MPVNLDVLVEEIVVSPFVSTYVFESIKSITHNLNLRKKVVRSSLYDLK